MATRPATTPEAMPRALGLPWVIHSANIQPSAAAAVAIWVTSMAMPAVSSAAAAEPALKPNQPTHSMAAPTRRSEEHTSELQSRENLVCRLLLEKKKDRVDIQR